MSNNTFYLNCPYSEKDLVKSLGARWDADARKWYVPSELDTKQFKRWWPKETKGETSAKIFSVVK